MNGLVHWPLIQISSLSQITIPHKPGRGIQFPLKQVSPGLHLTNKQGLNVYMHLPSLHPFEHLINWQGSEAGGRSHTHYPLTQVCPGLHVTPAHKSVGLFGTHYPLTQT